jgi:hypothetical protein
MCGSMDTRAGIPTLVRPCGSEAQISPLRTVILPLPTHRWRGPYQSIVDGRILHVCASLQLDDAVRRHQA